MLISTNSSSKETSVYKYKSVDGVIAFSDIEPLNADFEIEVAKTRFSARASLRGFYDPGNLRMKL